MDFDPTKIPPSKLAKLVGTHQGKPQFEARREAFFLAAPGPLSNRLTELESTPERYVIVGEPIIEVVQPSQFGKAGFLVLVTYWEIVGWKALEAPEIVRAAALPSVDGSTPQVAPLEPASEPPSETLTPPSPFAPEPPL